MEMALMKLVAATVVVCLGCGGGSGSIPDAGERSQDVADVYDLDDGLEVGQTDTATPPVEFWDVPGRTPRKTDFVAQRPFLSDLSVWSWSWDQSDPPELRQRPDFGVGNGHVFAMIGYGWPTNTLHSMAGPIYDKGEGFFSDVRVELSTQPGGGPVDWQSQWVGRVRSTPIVLTQSFHPLAMLTTVDFAPLTDNVDDPVRRAFLRMAVVRNMANTPLSGLELGVGFSTLQQLSGTGVIETREKRTRFAMVMGNGAVQALADGLTIPLPTIDPDVEALVELAFVMDDDATLREQTIQELAARGFDTLLEETRNRWVERLSGSTTLVTPDPAVNDYLDGQKIVVLSQIAHTGSAQPMCEYTGTWLRDNSGPVRFLLSAGLHETARSILDYLHLAARVEGSIRNSYAGDYGPEDAGAEPDWDSMGVMTGRTRAESPSYVPLMHWWYWKASGNGDFIQERFPMMKYCLEKQEFHGDLLPFSTDETYRTAMAVAHGLEIDEQFEEGFLSANSSFLWVAAARALAKMGESAGMGQECAGLASRAADVEAAAEETFSAQDGWYVPYVYEDGLKPAPAPFEDVNTMPVWSGYLAPLDPAAVANLSATITLLGGNDAILVSPLAEKHKGLLDLPISEGIYTGMAPGYFLQNLAVSNHPLGEEAFEALAKHATPLGTSPEYQILDDFSPLHLLYDSVGAIGDYTARFRPWEGGIVAAAAYDYLLGNNADAGKGSLELSPRLPSNWKSLDARNVRCGKTVVDVSLSREGSRLVFSLTHKSGPAVTVNLTLPFAGDAPPHVEGDFGPGGAPGVSVLDLPWGNRVVKLTGIDLEAGGAVAFIVH